MELNTPAYTVEGTQELEQKEKNMSTSFLIITYCCEVGKMQVDILENQTKNYQMNKKINIIKDGLLLHPT